MNNKSAIQQYVYRTCGVCPPEIHFKINDEKLKDLRFVGGGCPGNAQLVSRLLENKPLPEILSYIEGIECRNDTSCLKELARAIRAAQNGTLAMAKSFKVAQDPITRCSIAILGNPEGDNEILQIVLKNIRNIEVDAVLCLGNLTGDSPFNRNLIGTIHREKILTLQGEIDWRYSQNREQAAMPKMDTRERDWLFQLPQIVSFKLNTRKGMAFFGDYIQSFADYSDFEPFALEMNMVCGLANFMQDETVFPALEAMIPQFQADIILFSQMKTWGAWHVGGKDFISVGSMATESGYTWGLLTEDNGRADLKIMEAPS